MASDVRCPSCGSEMRERRNKKTNARFWGCVQYPACSGTRNIGAERDAEDDSDSMVLPSERAVRNDRSRWRDER